jgi:hypothetical protein
MDGMIMAHNGGLDEMAILLFPFIVGLGVWVLTRQPNGPEKKPKVLTDGASDSGE